MVKRGTFEVYLRIKNVWKRLEKTGIINYYKEWYTNSISFLKVFYKNSEGNS